MSLPEVLKQLEDLLRKYDIKREANIVMGVRDLYGLDKDKALQQINAASWWVGEDAVAEVDLSIAGGFMPEARADQHNFQQVIIKLYDLLKSEGFENDYAELVTSQFQKWNVSGM